MSDVTPLTPPTTETPQNTPKWQLRDLNSDRWYLLILNTSTQNLGYILDEAILDSSRKGGNPWIIRVVNRAQSCQMPWNTTHSTPQTYLADKPILADGLLYQSRYALNTSTQNLADEPTLANGPPREWAISHYYWHLVVKNGNFTLLLTNLGQEWQFHPATDI